MAGALGEDDDDGEGPVMGAGGQAVCCFTQVQGTEQKNLPSFVSCTCFTCKGGLVESS